MFGSMFISYAKYDTDCVRLKFRLLIFLFFIAAIVFRCFSVLHCFEYLVFCMSFFTPSWHAKHNKTFPFEWKIVIAVFIYVHSIFIPRLKSDQIQYLLPFHGKKKSVIRYPFSRNKFPSTQYRTPTTYYWIVISFFLFSANRNCILSKSASTYRAAIHLMNLRAIFFKHECIIYYRRCDSKIWFSFIAKNANIEHGIWNMLHFLWFWDLQFSHSIVNILNQLDTFGNCILVYK